ncbi:universal stress protein [Elizabethkingia meningoseptica]|uniref:universal stress protein n=1 Tax=Elizabethkingia meningoseptica TaxID=238 RepID=UPI0008415336|nr:universal stress protein [Elizabethkingia meningoseptica]ODM55171.1 universal stress protein UspA [Elizabethkingia meningoseptica]OHT30376.1 universal stress protein UspA [Elizabethkingia meningoseptica]OPC12112.1 universal stress protein UspA [Elizabethkingia meningoseptica]
MNLKSIIIALDESSYSPVIAQRGFELAAVFDAKLTMLLIRNNEAVLNASLANASIEDMASEEKLMKELKEIAIPYKAIQWGITILKGDPQEEIIRYIADNKADLLVVGTHGRTGIDHWVSGSVAEHVIRHATIPVLVMPYNHRAH